VFKARTQARTALFDSRFPTRAPGLVAMLIDYDPAAWLRCPVLGEDRTAWHDRSLTALTQDWGLRPGGNMHQVYDNVLNRTADDPLSHEATFLSIDKPADGTAIVCVDVADEEVTLLEHGDPDRWLAFDDLFDAPGIVVGASREKPRTVDTELRETARTSGDGKEMLIRAHRRIPSNPETHLTAFGFMNRPKVTKRLATAHQLIRSIRVETVDGQHL
jgi:hypothetical protein